MAGGRQILDQQRLAVRRPGDAKQSSQGRLTFSFSVSQRLRSLSSLFLAFSYPVLHSDISS